MKRLMLLLGAIALLNGCSQKVPEISGNENFGVLAVPMKAENNTGFPFTEYFILSSSTNPEFTIRLDPGVGRHFAFSEQVPPGEYVFDTETMYNIPTDRFSSKTHKESRVLRPAWKVKVEEGTLLIANKKFSVMFQKGDNDVYRTSWAINNLDWNEKRDYAARLAGLENADSWRILGQWEQY